MRPAGGAAHIPPWTAVSTTSACRTITILLTLLDISVCVLILRRYAQPCCAGSKACEPGGHGGGNCGQQRHGRNQLCLTHGAAARRPPADTGTSFTPQSLSAAQAGAEWGWRSTKCHRWVGHHSSTIFPIRCQGSSVAERAGSSVRWHLGAGAPRAGAARDHAHHR